MTELTAINRMLGYIGETRLGSTVLTSELVEGTDAYNALEVLNDTKKDLISRGYWFNTNEAWSLLPDEAGYIAIPQTYLKVLAEGYRVMDHKLYDIEAQVIVHNAPVEATIITDVNFDDLPESMAIYVMYMASIDFSMMTLGLTDMQRSLEIKAQRALLELQEDEFNFYNTSNLVDDWDIPSTDSKGF